MASKRLGPYQLVSQLAVGGMAEIYSAKTAGVGGFEKLVALKVIHPNFSEDPEFVQMLVDEAKLAVHLQHANIVQTFDLGRVDNQYYIAMELIDGIDLYRLLRRASEKDLDFPFEVAAFIAEEAAQGLDYAHRKRDERGRPLEIVHRDISPQNILVTFDGEVKIVDFGIAKAARRAKQTAAGVIKGKYYYMSPEQAWGEAIDARTDIFSTGILLYEMLVGQMLYLEEDMDVLLEKVRKAIIPKPSTRRKEVPSQLETIVMKALARRPQDRFQTAGELSTALSRFLRARAPDFNRAKLAAWAKLVMDAGDKPHARHEPRHPLLSTAVGRAEIERDQNSLIFKLDARQAQQLKAAQPQNPLKPQPVAAKPKPSAAKPKPSAAKPQPSAAKPQPSAAKPQPNAPKPRRGDQATSPVRMPDLARELGDYEENDATLVDGMSRARRDFDRNFDTDGDSDLDGNLDEQESTRPMGPAAQLRATFDEDEEPLDSSDEISDPLSSLADESEAKTDRTSLEKLSKSSVPRVEPRLPGVRTPLEAAEEETPPEETPEEETPPEETPEEETPEDKTPDEEETVVSGAKPASRPAAQPAWPPPQPPSLPLPPGLPVLPSVQASAFSAPPSSPGQLSAPPPPRSRTLLLAVLVVGVLAAASLALLAIGPPAPTHGTIEVVSVPSGAEVRIDGTAIAQPTPLVITDVDPMRSHHLVVGKKGPPPYESWESDVKFEGKTRQVRLQAVLVPQLASIALSSTPPGAEALVNGRFAGTTPTTISDLSPADEVVIELRLRGYRVAHRSLSFGGRRQLELAIPLEKAR